MRFGPVGLYRASGRSMEPTLAEGDLVLGWRWFRPQAGQIVIARTPERLIIKRIKRLTPGEAWLEGDNHSASSSGPVLLESIEAKLIKVF